MFVWGLAMRSAGSISLGTAVLCLGLVTAIAAQQPSSVKASEGKPARTSTAAVQTAKPAVSHATPQSAAAAHISVADGNGLVKKYCVGCHNDRNKDRAGSLTLASFDMAKAGEQADTAERMIRKMQASMMPPPGMPRPDPATYQQFIRTLETSVDAHAKANPNPGGRTFQRLNRPEYARAIKDLLEIEVEPGKWLPLDTMSANFDNIADEQALSPTLLESYLNAAADISRMAVGDKTAPSIDTTYTNPTYMSQHPWDHVEGAPFGTRGGMVVNHVFPADGEYQFEMTFNAGENTRFEDVDISIDGERVALVAYELINIAGADGRGQTPLRTEPILVKAGQHKVAAAFVKKIDGPYEDLIRPHDWSYAGGGSGGAGITTLPHMGDFVIRGPLKTTGISTTASRQKIFSCRPTSSANERTCAKQIIAKIGGEAYRRPVSPQEVDRLMPFYEAGAAKGGFEMGVRSALEAVLASPHFIFRLERAPTDARSGGTYRVADIDLASRLSFFIWGLPPDQDLIDAAGRRELSTLAGLEKHARRMLADPRGSALADRFAAQWLRLQDIEKVHPDPNFYPNFDENLAAAMRTETKMFFQSLVKEDRSVLELLSADYTFLNERLATHYGIKGVVGNEFRRVTYPDASRRGILGQGSMLVQTSLANRTSPVLRGKWVMEVLLGTPPPAPPPNIPALEEAGESKEGRLLTTREKMEIHRKNATCNSCHRFMDPIGLALDNFDVTAKWRQRENGMQLDTAGDFYDGTKVTSLSELTAALVKRPVPLVRNFTENLMAYGLGRRVEFFDQPTIRAIAKNAEANNYKISSFILGVVKSDAFRMRRVEPETTTTAEKN
jgi:mono/diheme cytochrome c family protein